MKECYKFYEYNEIDDKIKIYGDGLCVYFKKKDPGQSIKRLGEVDPHDIIVDSIDFDQYDNVILYIEDIKNYIINSELEKKLLTDIEHLNDVIVKNLKIILTFECKDIVLC